MEHEEKDRLKRLREKTAELKSMSAAELIDAYDHVRDLNLTKKDYGMGSLSGKYQAAVYEEMVRRMERR